MKTTLGTTVTLDENDAVWQPLKYQNATFFAKSEYLCVGANFGSGSYGKWYEDGTIGEGTSFHIPFQSANLPEDISSSFMQNYPTIGCSADFDADGIDEALFVMYDRYASPSPTFNMKGFKDGQCTSVWYPYREMNASLGTEIGAVDNYKTGDAALIPCQIDADDQEEFALQLGNTVYLFDMYAVNPGIWGCSIIGSRTFNRDISSFTAGDCDGDRLSEFCVCATSSGGTAGAQIFQEGLAETENWTDFTGYSSAYACFGDTDGDRIDEIIIFKASSNSYWDPYAPLYTDRRDWIPRQTKLDVYNLPIGNYALSTDDQVYSRTADGIVENYVGGYFPVCTDMDGDNKEGIFVRDELFYKPSTGVWTPIGVIPATNGRVPVPPQVGDYNGDGRDDLYVCRMVDQSVSPFPTPNIDSYRLEVLTLSPDSILSRVNWLFDNVQAPYVPAAVAANIDKDSPRVAFARHEFKYSSPVILAVLSAAPYY